MTAPPPITPPAHVYVYAPSGAVRDIEGFHRAVQRLREQGLSVALDAATLSSHQRFAGDDATRLAAIARAAASGAAATLIARGGYGLTRLLPALPYAAITNSIAAGTRWIGFSDFTALQMGLLAWCERQGLPLAVTWAGPALVADFGATTQPNATMLAYFEKFALNNQSKDKQPQNLPWELNWEISSDCENAFNGSHAFCGRLVQKSFSAEVEPYCLSGILWGGNLAALSSLVGTPWLPPIKNGILFLEDVGEHPYRIERMLSQLFYAGILSEQKAILFGSFSEYQLNAHDAGFDIHSVIQWLREKLPHCLLLDHLPFGHVPTKAMLPVGAMVQLTILNNQVQLTWNGK